MDSTEWFFENMASRGGIVPRENRDTNYKCKNICRESKNRFCGICFLTCRRL